MRGRLLGALTILLLAGCRPGEQRAAPLFKLLTPRRTGVSFANTITPTDSLNAVTDAYIYNGAGVGVGDIDNDGLPDLFFAGNMVSSRLYLNKGGMRFEDITAAAGVATRGWASGVTLVDINHDGWLDIYVSRSGPEWSTPAERANLLFINNGNRTFTESAAQYGIADGGFTTHAVFLDYDRDGDLDLFLLNNSPYDFVRGQLAFLPPGVQGKAPTATTSCTATTATGHSRMSRQRRASCVMSAMAWVSPSPTSTATAGPTSTSRTTSPPTTSSTSTSATARSATWPAPG